MSGPAMAETLPPPKNVIGPVAWLRDNLFSGWVNGLVTLLIGAALVWFIVTIGS